MALGPDIQQQVYDLLSRASNISFVSSDQEAAPRISLTPGQRVSAEVLTILPNNRTQVRVGTERFNLDLPMAVRPGQTLEMTFISDDPRSTFAIARQGGLTPPVSLSDASRLLSLLVGAEQLSDPKLRSSLQNIGDMLRRSSGEAGVLANLLDEAMTYGGVLREGVKGPAEAPGGQQDPSRQGQEGLQQGGGRQPTPEQARLAAFEANASQILRNIAQSSRFILVEAANQASLPVPLLPGQEVDGTVAGTLPGGRAFVQVAGTTLELALPRAVQQGEILRLTVIATQPRPLFAVPRLQPERLPDELSEAGRWLSVLEHSEGGISEQQVYVLERLGTVLKSLPPDSPAFTAILDEAITYETVMRGKGAPTDGMEQGALAAAAQSRQALLQPGNGIVLNDDMAKLLQAVIKGNRLALLEAINQQAQPSGLMPGQQLRGEVLAALGGGRFVVQVGDQALEFSMPRGTRRGDMAQLFFITDEPRPTFLMVRFGGKGDARLSETGRWLSTFLQAGSRTAAPAEALGILRTILAEPPRDGAVTSQALQRGLQESGLFYEAHLARWFGGDYPLEELLREPQGRLSPRLTGPHLPVPAAGVPAGADGQAPQLSAGMAATEEPHPSGQSRQPREGAPDPRVLPLVNEQLTALQNGQIHFRGELFPGQQLHWTVSERDARRGAGGERESRWETALELELPGLGPLKARLGLDGARLTVQVTAAEALTVATLGAARDQLAQQLEAAGFTAAEIGVGQHESV